MALFDWFSKKIAADTPIQTQPPSSGLMHDQATLPMQPGGSLAGGDPQAHAVNRKTERLERRELLYGVVRDSMTHLGVLSAGYKFKVLSLDSRGNQFLIMMDLDARYLSTIEQLAEFESLIAKNAKTRYDIAVTSVYWRVIEQVTAGLSVHAPAASKAPVAQPVMPAAAAPSAPAHPSIVDEFAAFKQARAEAAKASASGTAVPSKAVVRDSAPPQDFQNTQLDDSHSPLSGTQYGELK